MLRLLKEREALGEPWESLERAWEAFGRFPGCRRESPEISPGAMGRTREGQGKGGGGHERFELGFSNVLFFIVKAMETQY